MEQSDLRHTNIEKCHLLGLFKKHIVLFLQNSYETRKAVSVPFTLPFFH